MQGYKGQFGVIIDDVLQNKDNEKVSSLILEIIAMANDATYNINMAALNEKGNTFF